LKIDHPSFFHSFCSTRADGGSLPDSVPSSLSESAGTAFVPPGEPDLFLNGGIPLYNKLVPSSTVGRRRIAFRNSGNTPHAKTKKAPDPCKPSEAMVKIINFVELPIVCGALLQSPKLHSSGFPFFIPSKSLYIHCESNEKKNQPFSLRRARVGQIPKHFFGGSILLSKGGSIQMGVEERKV
jgi:hypothetical protein